MEDIDEEYEDRREDSGSDVEERRTRKSSKRERASLEARLLLENIFQTNQYPDLELRTKLGRRLGMTPRKVQIWFQNRRTKAKMKTVKKKAENGEEKGWDPNVQNAAGNTLLIIAASVGHWMVPDLLSSGAKCNTTNHKGQTALYAAILNGHENTVQTLLQVHHGCDPNIVDAEYGQAPLHLAALKGLEVITNLLLTRGQNIDVNIRDTEDRTPLLHACVQGHVMIAKMLILQNADIEATNSEGITCLHAAALNGNVELVRLLLSKGANVQVVDSLGYSALCFAVREGKEEVVKLLLQNAASLTMTTHENFTPMHIACCRKNTKIVQMLLDFGGIEQLQESSGGITPLELAKLHNNTLCVDYLTRVLSKNKF